MNDEKTLRFARWFAVLAGGGDLLTGIGLVAAPALTLGAMGVAVPAAEALVFVRFIGAFVGAVGASYWLALATRRPERLWAVFRVTLVLRFSVGTFVAGAVVAGALAWPWLSVTATDVGIAAVQLWLLRKEPAHG